MIEVEHWRYDPASKSWKNDDPRTSSLILLTITNHPLKSANCRNGMVGAQATHKQRTRSAQAGPMRQLLLPNAAQAVAGASCPHPEVEVVQQKEKKPKTLH